MLLRNGRTVGKGPGGDGLFTVVKFAIVTRVCTFVLALLANLAVQDYDSSNDCNFHHNLSSSMGQESWTQGDVVVCKLFNMFSHWDGVYFLRIAEKRTYEFEQFHAFFPLPAMLASGGGELIQAVSGSFLSQRSSLVLASCLVSFFSFVLAAALLYKLTLSVTRNEKFSITSALMFCLTPASIFMSATYSEAVYAALAFGSLWLIADGNLVAATIVLCLNGLTRSNNTLMCGYIVYPVFIAVCRYVFGKGTSGKGTGIQSIVLHGVGAVVSIVVACSSTIAVLYYGYTKYCTGGLHRAWCDNTIPSIYSHVQKEYWNVGFLNYYEPKQIPNFLLAAPMILLASAAIVTHYRADPQRWLTLGVSSSNKTKTSSNQWLDVFVNISPVYMFHWAILLFLGITIVHVQVITRFMSATPPLYWFTAVLVGRGGRTRTGILVYCMLYQALGAIVFTNFYPWT